MQKTVLKVFIEQKRRPLFVVDLYDDVEKSIEEFEKQLENKDKFIIKFGSISFKKSLYHHHEVIIK